MNKKGYIVISIAIILMVVGVIAFSSNTSKETNQTTFEIQNAHSSKWSKKQLTNVLSGQVFKISSFEGEKHVLLESFAVWCPTCTKQQRKIKEFHENTEKEVASISLNTDPNEDSEKVKTHAEKNGFDWKYAISPRETTKNLIDEFGQGFVNAPQSPIVLICKDGRAKMLERGVKNGEDLEKAVSQC